MLEKLARQTVIYGISSIAARLLNYLLTPYLTRVFDEATYGIITDMYALIPFALVVLTLGMESGYFRFAGKAAGPEERLSILGTTWGATTAAGALFFVAVAAAIGPVSRIMDYAAHPEWVLVVAGIVLLDVATAIPFARLREREQAGRYVALRVLSVVVNVALCLAFGAAGLYRTAFGVGYVFVANLIASAVTLVAILPTIGRVRPHIDRKLLGAIFLYSLPLLLSGIAGTGTQFIDRQMIKYLLPADTAMAQLGIYGAVTKIAVILVLFTQMYRLAAEPFFLQSFRRDDFRQANAAALKYYVIVAVAIFLGIMLYVDLFAYIVGPDFRTGLFILPVVLGAYALSGVWLNLSFWYKQTGRTIFALVVTGTGLAVTVLLNLWLVPRLGYYGSAWARLGCEAAMVAISYALNHRYFPTPYDLPRMAEYLVLGALLFVASRWTEHLGAPLHYTLNSGLYALFLLYAVRRERIDWKGLVRAALRRG